jgi:hypothetical protein
MRKDKTLRFKKMSAAQWEKETDEFLDEEKATSLNHEEQAVFDILSLVFEVDRIIPDRNRPMGDRSHMPEIIPPKYEEDNDLEMKLIAMFHKEEYRNWLESIRDSKHYEIEVMKRFKMPVPDYLLTLWYEVTTEWMRRLNDKERIAVKGYAMGKKIKQIQEYSKRKTGKYPDRKSIYNWYKSGIGKLVKYLPEVENTN